MTCNNSGVNSAFNLCVTALAPMQAVTTLPFMKVIEAIGAPDYFFTEYFRVHETSTLEPHIVASIIHNPSPKPIYAQMIGENIPHLKRTVLELLKLPIAGIDLNMGCPAPKVYKKNVGGGLLRDLSKIDAVLGELRAIIPIQFTVKMRIGFEDTHHFPELLSLIKKHQVDLLSLHARTVKEMYGPNVQYDYIEQAVDYLECPVLANGELTSVDKIKRIVNQTGAQGAMIGRSAIRNPWIFRQVGEARLGLNVYQPKLSDIYSYIHALYEATLNNDFTEERHIAYLKKFLNFIAISVDSDGHFMQAMRRAQTLKVLFEICNIHLLDKGRSEHSFALEPYPDLVARPNRELNPKACG